MGIFQRLWENLKKLFIVFKENFRKLGHVNPRNLLASLEKLLQWKTDSLAMNQNRIDLQQQPISLKELMLTLALKYQGTLFPEDIMK